MIDDAWSRIDDTLDALRAAAVEAQAMPESLALVFHDGRFSGGLATPPFVLEDADVITDELCRLLPSLGPDQVAVVWPAQYQEGPHRLIAMKVHLWERSRADEMVTRLIPVPIHGSLDGPSVDMDPPDPWSQRLARALARTGRLGDTIVDARFPPGFLLMVDPDGALGTLRRLDGDEVSSSDRGRSHAPAGRPRGTDRPRHVGGSRSWQRRPVPRPRRQRPRQRRDPR